MKGALANEIPGMLPEPLRQERQARFMKVQEEVSIAKLRGRVGQTMQVLIDQISPGGKQGAIGRSYADAPEIDGVVKLLAPQKVSQRLKVGNFVKARIVDTDGHDLIGQPL